MIAGRRILPLGALLLACRDDRCDEDRVLELREGKVCFSAPQILPFPSAVGSVSLADIDRDGDGDIVAMSTGGAAGESLFVLRNLGAREFEPTTLDLGLNLRRRILDDLDADGDPDVALLLDEGEVLLLANNEGSFEVSNQIAADARALLTVDLDADGAASLLVVTDDDSIQVTDAPLDAESVSVEIGEFSGDAACLSTGEVTGDGRIDLITPTRLFPGSSDGYFDPPLVLDTVFEGACGLLLDLNGDSIDDYVECGRARLGPWSSDSVAIEIPDLPSPGGEICLAEAIARPRSAVETYVVLHDRVDSTINDGTRSPACPAITSVIPAAEAGGQERGHLELTRSSGWKLPVTMSDADGDGTTDIVENTSEGVQIRYGESCE